MKNERNCKYASYLGFIESSDHSLLHGYHSYLSQHLFYMLINGKIDVSKNMICSQKHLFHSCIVFSSDKNCSIGLSLPHSILSLPYFPYSVVVFSFFQNIPICSGTTKKSIIQMSLRNYPVECSFE